MVKVFLWYGKVSSFTVPQFYCAALFILQHSIFQNLATMQMETLLSIQFKICDEKRRYLEQMKEIMQMNYIKADTDVLKLGVKGSLNYFYQTKIEAVRKPTMRMIIFIIVVMPKTKMIIRTMYTRLTL